ncbi:MAG TPA: ATP-binding protein [Longimicrobiales bacterium]|nr:ATP-binding protein [Longimicrobiales bacterium]
MVARIKSLLPSLGVRLLVPLFVAVGAVLAVHAFLSFRSAEDRFLVLVRGEAHRASGLIRRATHDGMLLNRLDEVQATIERLAEGGEVAAIRVYDREGTIVLSSDRTEMGRRGDLAAAPCASCHGDGTPGVSPALEAVEVTEAGTGEGGSTEKVLRHLSVIANEPNCSTGGCHSGDAGKHVLGVLDVEMSMQPLDAALGDARIQLLGTTLALFVAIALVAAFVFRRFVRHPIAELQEGARRIAGGDLSTRIEVRGGHELALLATDFNRMAEDLSRAQREVDEWSRTLEEKVEERTEELKSAQHQVMHMEKMASLGKLSATVAHELNNPLSGILTYARLVERELGEQPIDEGVRAELARYLSVVQQESTRCGAIVKNLLVFARREGGEMAFTDLNEIVDRSLMLVRHHMEMSGVTLQARLLEGDPLVFGLAGELQQALVALFVNAVEAMKKGGELRVSMWGDAVQVAIDIEDTGTGIPAEVLPNIFEPFFSTKEKESGVGLGLAVVYGIIHRHKGIIGVESEVGKGTVFHIVLPRDLRPRELVATACPWAPGMVGRGA